MANRYDVIVAEDYQDRDGNKKTAFTNVGSLVPSKSGEGYSLFLKKGLALVPNGDGSPAAIARPPKPRDSGSAAQSAGGGSPSRDGDIF